jgi:hypothetical protein
MEKRGRSGEEPREIGRRIEGDREKNRGRSGEESVECGRTGGGQSEKNRGRSGEESREIRRGIGGDLKSGGRVLDDRQAREQSNDR